VKAAQVVSCVLVTRRTHPEKVPDTHRRSVMAAIAAQLAAAPRATMYCCGARMAVNLPTGLHFELCNEGWSCPGVMRASLYFCP